GNNLNTIYKSRSNSFTSSYYFIGHSYKSVSGSTWYENETFLETGLYNLDTYAFVANNTVDGKIHIIYWDKNLQYYVHRYLSGTNFSSVIAQILISEKDGYNSLLSVSNDLFMIYANNFSTPGKISFRHYDAAPLTPSNFAGSILDLGYNAHPKLTWSLNNEPDVRGNTIDGYIIERSLNYAAFSPCTTLSGDTNEFIDIGVHYAGSGPGTARYRIKSRDINDHESPWSNIVSINYGNVWKAGSVYEIIN